MPRITTPLNATQVKQAKPLEKEYNLCDGAGLMLRIKPNKTKLWIFNYIRPYTKKRTNISLGLYPALSLQDARKKRDIALEQLAKNIDPKIERDEKNKAEKRKHTNILKEVTQQWIEIKKSKVTDDHANDIWRSLELHIFPMLGNIPIHQINAPDTIDVIKPIASKGSLETVKRICQRLNEVMVYAVNTGYIHHNPLSGIKDCFANPLKKHMPTINSDELPAFNKSLVNANINKTTRHLIEWQLHTMVRPSEAASTRWDEIDFDNKLWNIPTERMKKKRPHTVPLTQFTLEILNKMRPISGHRKFVFPSHRTPTNHIHPSTANMAIRRMGYSGKLVAHGLRALASTILNDQRFDSELIESALAHVEQSETRRAYNRAKYIEHRRKLMCWWSDYILKN